MGFLLLRFWMQTSIPEVYRLVVVNFCKNRFREEIFSEWGFRFVVSNFVLQLALFCTTNVQLITDVYHHHLWCRFKEQMYLLKDSAAWSEPCAGLELVAGLQNIWTVNVMTVRKLETHFWCEIATERLLRKNLLLADVKLTWDCCHCAIRARSRRQYLISNMLRWLKSKLLKSISCNRKFFQKVFWFKLMLNFRPIIFSTWFSDSPKILLWTYCCTPRAIIISAATYVKWGVLRTKLGL